MRRQCLSVIVAIVSVVSAVAESPRIFWTAEMGEVGVYMVDIDKLVSASIHRYVVDSTAQVTEFTVIGEGSGIARFYHVGKLLDSKDLAARIKSLAGDRQMEWNLVVKNYPTSTHAHTVEFLLKDRESARQLFESLNSCIRSRRETTFREGQVNK